jgi:hypothetical protein
MTQLRQHRVDRDRQVRQGIDQGAVQVKADGADAR